MREAGWLDERFLQNETRFRLSRTMRFNLKAEGLGRDLAAWAPAIYGPKLSGTPEMMHLYGVGQTTVAGPTRAHVRQCGRRL